MPSSSLYFSLLAVELCLWLRWLLSPAALVSLVFAISLQSVSVCLLYNRRQSPFALTDGSLSRSGTYGDCAPASSFVGVEPSAPVPEDTWTSDPALPWP